MDRKRNYFTISQLSTMLGISGPTLRFWEKEFDGILQPLRTNGGQRRYTVEHFSIVEDIKTLKKAGLSLVEIKRKLENNHYSKDLDRNGVDLLVNRLTEVIKIEVLRFLQKEEEVDKP